jgi:hypothetical protein
MTLPSSWASNKKVKARYDSVVAPWREVTGLASIPSEGQYWTLCGKLTDVGGVAIPQDGELQQLVGTRLIVPEQFHGVERDRVIHGMNAAAVEREFGPKVHPHLYCGDLVRVLDSSSVSESFHPAIVNIDTPASPKHGFEPLAGALAVLNRTSHEVMVVWNVVAEDRLKGQQRNFQSQLERYSDYEFLDRQLRAGQWLALGQYEYGGTSAYSVSKMVSFVFWNGRRRRKAA